MIFHPAVTESSSSHPSPEEEMAEDKEEKDEEEDDDDVTFKTGEKVVTHPTGQLNEFNSSLSLSTMCPLLVCLETMKLKIIFCAMKSNCKRYF